MLSRPVPEPMRDIAAQIGALHDPAHPKRAVYIAPGKVRVYQRDEGALLTDDAALAARFMKAELSDDDMAAILGYPETKASVIASDRCLIVQARNAAGDVITEAAASAERMFETVRALFAHVPPGGVLRLCGADAALKRRMESQ